MEENHKRWLAIGLSITIGISIALYKVYSVILPGASEYIAERIPNEVYQKIGESSLRSFDQSEFTTSQLTVEKQSEISAQYKQLIENLKLDPTKFKIHFRYWDGKMNAFALMDGSIVVTDALITNLTHHRQIDAVLLHEIGHIEHNHIMENIIRVSLFYISMSFIFGDVSVVSDLLIEGSTLGINTSYSRQFEGEADSYAIEQLNVLYDDSSAMKDALSILYKNSEEEQFHWLATHPTFEARMENIHEQSVQ